MHDKETYKLVWDKFIGGDNTALVELYNQHYVSLINYGRIIIGDRDLVRDCFMDMLIDFWNKRRDLPKVENVRSYLMTSFRRVILHQVDANKRRLAKDHASIEHEIISQESYEEYLVQIQSNDAIKYKIARALNLLTDRQAELIRLRFFEDLDYEEISERCNITKRTAYNIIYDAIKLLKQELANQKGGDADLSLIVMLLLLSLHEFRSVPVL